jgi:methylated-DNA-[protein]-cysteine S-methyltransferase
MRIRYTTFASPVGSITVAWKGETVVCVHMDEAVNRTSWRTRYRSAAPIERLRSELSERFGDVELEHAGPGARPARAFRRYFAGDRHALDRLAVDPGGTPFQAKVWKRLRAIPAGRTMTYGELADAVGAPGAARAAGGAVGSNPIPVIIPCHRVVGSDRKLTGFGGGLERKLWLLEHEGAAMRRRAPRAAHGTARSGPHAKPRSSSTASSSKSTHASRG